MTNKKNFLDKITEIKEKRKKYLLVTVKNINEVVEILELIRSNFNFNKVNFEAWNKRIESESKINEDKFSAEFLEIIFTKIFSKEEFRVLSRSSSTKFNEIYKEYNESEFLIFHPCYKKNKKKKLII